MENTIQIKNIELKYKTGLLFYIIVDITDNQNPYRTHWQVVYDNFIPKPLSESMALELIIKAVNHALFVATGKSSEGVSSWSMNTEL